MTDKDQKGPAPISRASGGQHNADMAADRVHQQDLDYLGKEARQDVLVDEAVEETFPASDPISPKRIT